MTSPARRFVISLAALLVCLASVRCRDDRPLGPSDPTSRPPASPGPPLPPAPAVTQVFVGAGDIGFCDGNSVATGRLIDATGGTVFTLGDHAYPAGTSQQFRDCYDPSWGGFKARTFPTPGNHEYLSANAQPYFEYFGPNAGVPGLGYYSFPLGAWHAISLNSNIAVDAASPQADWVRIDLAINPSTCSLAYWHHPLFSSGPNGDTTRMRGIWRILYEAGADIVLSGHDHFYERFGPQDADGRPDPVRGIRQFIAGTGGAPVYQPVTVRHNSEVRISAFGVLKLTLMADRYEWQFMPVSGPGDSGTGLCH